MIKATYYTPVLNSRIASLKFSTFNGKVLIPVDDLSDATFFTEQNVLVKHLKDLSSKHKDDEVTVTIATIQFDGYLEVN
jgi:hypothetical protein